MEDSDIWMDQAQGLKADKREWCTVPRQQGVPRQIPVEVLIRDNLPLTPGYVTFLCLHHHHLLPYLPQPFDSAGVIDLRTIPAAMYKDATNWIGQDQCVVGGELSQ